MDDSTQHVFPYRVPGLVVAPAEIDIATVPEFSAALGQASLTQSTIIVDLTGTSFCDCSTFSALVPAFKRAAEGGGEVRLVISSARIQRICEMTGMDIVFPIFRTVAAAAWAGPAGRPTARDQAAGQPARRRPAG